MAVATFVISIIGVALYMAHFWVPMPIAELVLWPIAGFCAIFSIYGGIIGRTRADDNHEKGRLTAAVVIGGVLLLGLSLSAILLFH